MKTLKLSYSILNTWSKGKFDEAVGQYLGKPMPATPHMEFGKIKHEIWSNYASTHKKLHPELGSDALFDPVVETKYQRLLPLNEEYQILLRGIPDVYDCPPHLNGERIIELKTGLGTATSYVDEMQLPYMKLLRPNAILGEYHCYNQYFGKLTKAVRYLDDTDADLALNHIYTYGGELLQYLLANKLFIDYKEVHV